jgi:hypothetical protein
MPSSQKADCVSLSRTIQPRFMPKNPVTKASGRKMVATTVSRYDVHIDRPSAVRAVICGVRRIEVAAQGEDEVLCVDVEHARRAVRDVPRRAGWGITSASPSSSKLVAVRATSIQKKRPAPRSSAMRSRTIAVQPGDDLDHASCARVTRPSRDRRRAAWIRHRLVVDAWCTGSIEGARPSKPSAPNAALNRGAKASWA